MEDPAKKYGRPPRPHELTTAERRFNAGRLSLDEYIRTAERCERYIRYLREQGYTVTQGGE